MKHVFSAFLCLTFLVFVSCGNNQKNEENITRSEFPLFDSSIAAIDRQGFIGIYYVPDIPVISILDSASVSRLPQKVAESYKALGTEMSEIGVVQAGAPGQLMYNRDTANFRFECFCPIKNITQKKTRRCKLVMIPGGDMLVYNYYGPYQQLYLSYDALGQYIKENNLEQMGAMREFYITDPNSEPDENKWLTRVMVPVKVKG